MGFIINKDDRKSAEVLDCGSFGLEKENLRIDENGNLSHTKHPFGTDFSRDRDFCENQVEMITGVNENVDSMWNEIAELDRDTKDTILKLDTGKEYLWPFSNPPYVKGEDDIPIAQYEGELAVKTVYREHLAATYGKKKMLFSGIHYNFSFSDNLLKSVYESGNQNGDSFEEFKNRIYLDLSAKVLEKSWMIVYLLAASPVFDGSFFDDGKIGETVISKYASPRCSEIGYWNHFTPILDFESLKGYVDSIQGYVDSGALKEASELYYPVRLKPRGANSLSNLLAKGVDHIELRMLDLNPLSEIGIDKNDLKFIHYLILYLSLKPELKLNKIQQETAIQNMKNASLLNSDDISIVSTDGKSENVTKEIVNTLNDMSSVLSEYIEKEKVEKVISYQVDKVTKENHRYADIVVEKYGKNFVEDGLKHLIHDND